MEGDIVLVYVHRHCTNGTCFHMNPDYRNVLEGPCFRDFFVTDSLYMFGKARKCNQTL